MTQYETNIKKLTDFILNIPLHKWSDDDMAIGYDYYCEINGIRIILCLNACGMVFVYISGDYNIGFLAEGLRYYYDAITYSKRNADLSRLQDVINTITTVKL